MTTQQKTTEVKKTPKVSAVVSTEKLEHTESPTAQVVETATLKVEETTVTAEEASLNTRNLQEQLSQFKQELVSRLETLKVQISSSQHDFKALGATVKAEVSSLIEDLTKLGSGVKTDVTVISTKHKAQISESFKRSKAHTFEIWSKVKQ